MIEVYLVGCGIVSNPLNAADLKKQVRATTLTPIPLDSNRKESTGKTPSLPAAPRPMD
jgi:hypothetical protein